MLYVLFVLVGLPALALLPAIAAQVFNHFTAKSLAARFNPSPRVFGPDAPPIALLSFLNWTAATEVAWLLMEVADDEAGCILLLLRKRHARQVLACLPPPRQEALEYWMDHPQAFTRQRQAYLARRFKRQLERATA
ncbi:MAG: hypothetical protein JWM80_1243 [Cyanobacteria bacterium RYN_339]|nr:hypothetical protein [Cyanobacteria bacterium RYN_339]